MLEAVASGLLDWDPGGGAAEYAVGAQWRRETYELNPYTVGAPTPRGGALHDIGIYPCPGGPDITSCQKSEGVFSYRTGCDGGHAGSPSFCLRSREVGRSAGGGRRRLRTRTRARGLAS